MTVTRMNAILTVNRHSGQTGVKGGFFYFAMGSQGTVQGGNEVTFGRVDRYNPVTDVLTSMGDVPDISKRQGYAGGVINGRFYATGGRRNLVNLMSINPACSFDPEDPAGTQNFTPAADPVNGNPPSNWHNMAGLVADGRVWMLGGSNGGNAVTHFWSMLPTGGAAGTWKKHANFPVAIRDLPGMVYHTATNSIYVFGGSGAGNVDAQSDQVRRYTIDTDTWTTLSTPMAVKRMWLAATIAGDEVLLFGGLGPGNVDSATIQRYNIVTQEAVVLADVLSEVTAFPFPAFLAPGSHFVAGGINRGTATNLNFIDRFTGVTTPTTATGLPPFPIGDVKVNCLSVRSDVQNFHVTRGVNEIPTADVVLHNFTVATPPTAKRTVSYLDDVVIRMSQAGEGIAAAKIRFEGFVENAHRSSPGYDNTLQLQCAGFERALAKEFVKCWNQRYRDKSIKNILRGTLGGSTTVHGNLPGANSLLFNVRILARCNGNLLTLPLHVNFDTDSTTDGGIADDAITQAAIPYFTVSDGMTCAQALTTLAELFGYRWQVKVKRDDTTDEPLAISLVFQPRKTSADTVQHAFDEKVIQNFKVRKDNTQRVDMVQVVGNRDVGIMGQFPLKGTDTSPAFDPAQVKRTVIIDLPNLVQQKVADDLAKSEYNKRGREQLEGSFEYDGVDNFSVNQGDLVQFTSVIDGFTTEKAEVKRVSDRYTHNIVGMSKYVLEVEPDKGIYLQQRSVAELSLRISLDTAFTAFIKQVTEEPKGVKNGVNTLFTLQSTPVEGTAVVVLLNGVAQNTTDFAVRENVVYMRIIPVAEDDLKVTYIALDPTFTCLIRAGDGVKATETVTATLEAPGAPL